jgi:hypothetical protein
MVYTNDMGTNTALNTFLTNLSAAVGWDATWAELEALRLDAVTVLSDGGSANDVASLASALLGDRVSWATLEGLRLELAASL